MKPLVIVRALCASFALACTLSLIATGDSGPAGVGTVSAQTKRDPSKPMPAPVAFTAEELCAHPAGLTAGAAAMDAVKRVAYLFGGSVPKPAKEGEDADADVEFTSDLRALDLKAAKPEWKTLKTTGESPTKRAWAAAAISQKRRTLYVFGGYGDKPGAEPDAPQELLNDFYALDLESLAWTKISPPDDRDHPGVRDVHAMLINESSQTLWLSGGIGEASATAFSARDDLWSYSIADGLWKQHQPSIAITPDKAKPTKGIPDARFGHTMVLDHEDRILIAGGQSARLRTQTTTWIFDPRTGQLTPGPRLPDGRSGGTGLWSAAQQAMLIVGGQSEAGEHDDVIAWRPGESNWHHCGRTGAPGYYGAAWLDSGVKGGDAIIAAPGRRDEGRPLATAKLLRLTPKGTSTPATYANMMVQDGLPVAVKACEGVGNRYSLCSVFDPVDGRVIAWGGQENVYENGQMVDGRWHGDFRVLKVGEKPALTWETLSPKEGSPAPSPRSYAAMAIAPKARKIWLFAGFGPRTPEDKGAAFFDDLWVFDLKELVWQQIEKPADAPWPRLRDAHPLMISDDEKSLYTFGGLEQFAASGLKSHADLWRFDIGKGTWTEIKPAEGAKFPSDRFFNGMVNIGGGKALMFGGFTGNGRGIHNDMWELDLATGTFAEKPSPGGPSALGARSAFAYAWDAKHGRVLMAGGSRAGVTDDIFAYVPAKGVWEKVGHTGLRAAYGTAVCDPKTGALYTFGGTVGSFFDEHCENLTMQWLPKGESPPPPTGKPTAASKNKPAKASK